MRMPFTAAFEKLTTGPDKSCAVPTTISLAVTPCCASAGVAAMSASVAAARCFIPALPRIGCSDNRTTSCSRHAALRRFPLVHALDAIAAFLVHQLTLELHRRGQFLVPGCQLLLDQVEFARLFDAEVLGVHSAI